MKKTILEIIDYPFDWEYEMPIEEIEKDIAEDN